MLTFGRVNSFLLGFFLVLNLINFFMDTGPWPYIVLFSVYFAFVVWGSSQVCSGYHFKVLCKGIEGSEAVALTFDDGPHPEKTPQLLDVLKKHSIQAVFFVTGENARRYPGLLQRMVEEGHAVANHTYYHGFFFDLKLSWAMRRELISANESIRSAIGKTPALFRPPYGVTNPALKRALRKTGLTAVGWSLKTADTAAGKASVIMKRLEKTCKGDIILMHDTAKFTTEVLEHFIPSAMNKGIRFMRADQLLGIKPYSDEH